MRPAEVDYPDGGKSTSSYTPTLYDVKQHQSASAFGEAQSFYDVYGRLSQSKTLKDQNNDWYITTYCYDGRGNLQYQSYGAVNQASCSLPGDTLTYDVLGRTTSVTHADGTTVSYKYVGQATQITDENKVTRILQVDGLGQLVATCEISNATLP